jgi:SH3-like domain-containing protein
MLPRLLRPLLSAVLAGATLVAAGAAQALDYRSIAAPTVMYDSPSTKGTPLFIINTGTPVEAVVAIEGWNKVRDMQGTLAWVEKKQLTEKRTVQVRVDRARVFASADDKAALVFEAARDVVLDLLEVSGGGWIKVRHQDGQSGYIKTLQVWGL